MATAFDETWECFFCEGGFHYRPGNCQDCGVELRRVSLHPEA